MINVLSNLVNAKQMSIDHPDTFSVPSDNDLARLRPGDFVKICRHDERFWVLLELVEVRQLVGTVNNDLVRAKNQDLPLGTPVCVGPEHVFDIHRISRPLVH